MTDSVKYPLIWAAVLVLGGCLAVQAADPARAPFGVGEAGLYGLPAAADPADMEFGAAAGSNVVLGSPPGTEPDLAARVQQLEQTVRELQGCAVDPVFEQPAADSTVTGFTYQVRGRIHIDQWTFPDDSPGVNLIERGNPLWGPIDRLMYRRLRLGVSGTVPPGNMSYQLEIEHSGEDGSQFRDAWLGWDQVNGLGTVRLGNQKRPYGLDHLNSSNFNIFLERPFIVEAFNEDARRFGLAVSGVTDDEVFNWRYGVYDLNLIQDIGSTLNDQYPLEFAGRIASTYWYDPISGGRGYGHFALSGSCALPDPDVPAPGVSDSRIDFRTRPEGRSTNRWLDTEPLTGADAYQLLGIESVVNVGSVQCGGEFMNVWLQRQSSAGPDLNFHGAYAYISWFLTGEYIPWNRQEGIIGRVEPLEDFFRLRGASGCTLRGIGAWQVAARFSYGDLTDKDVFGGVGQSATLAVNWYLNANTRLQWNYIFGRIEDSAAGGLPAPGVSGSYQISGVRGMIEF